jgi:hypothetical protein
MSALFKGPAKFPEWQIWRDEEKRMAEVTRRECNQALNDPDEQPNYVETDIGRMVSGIGLSFLFSAVIIVLFIVWADMTAPTHVGFGY